MKKRLLLGLSTLMAASPVLAEPTEPLKGMFHGHTKPAAQPARGWGQGSRGVLGLESLNMELLEGVGRLMAATPI